jgi:hypothetical protein
LSYKEEVYNFGYCPLRLFKGFKQTSKLAHSKSFLLSSVLATNLVASAI